MVTRWLASLKSGVARYLCSANSSSGWPKVAIEQRVNPFSLDTVRIPVSRIVDRQRQIAYLREHVVTNGANVLVTGEFGIGKTCLLRKFRAGLHDDYGSKVLLIEMEMRRLSRDASE